MPSGICSVGGTCTWPIRPPFAGAGAGAGGIAPVMSLPPIGATVGGLAPCVIVICELSSMFGADELLDCRPSGIGEVIDGAAGACMAGATLLSAGESEEAGSSIAGIGGAELVSSRFIAILKVPSTITTTLAPTSSERIFEVMFEPSVPGVPGAGLGLSFAFSLAFSTDAAFAAALAERLSFCALAAAACAARRAAAMKLDVLTDSFGAAAGISLSALSEAAMRSDVEALRGIGRVPGPSG